MTLCRLRAGKETPPRAWGRPTLQRGQFFGIRNTPTSVGKTWRFSCLTLSIWKHPHERGEDIVQCPDYNGGRETPPRAWGRHGKSPFNDSRARNTPTSVGKTSPERLGQFRYGETPPRAWGRLYSTVMAIDKVGNTPTSVGKTSSARNGTASKWKHPHERGEDGLCHLSSHSAMRNTPTSVGKTTRIAQRACNEVETPPRAWGRP